MVRIAPWWLLVVLLSVISQTCAIAATYTYTSFEPKPEWNATDLFIRGINDLGGMVGVTYQANSPASRDWRFIPGLGLMRWNIPSNRPHSIWDINNRGQIVQIVFVNESEQVWLCQPTPCKALPIPEIAPSADHLTNTGHIVGSYPKGLDEFPDDPDTRVGYIFDTQANQLREVAIPGWPVTILTGLTDDGLFTGLVDKPVIYPDPQEVSFWGDETQLQPFVIPGSRKNQIVSVSNRDTRVGLAFFETDTVSFVWALNGTVLQEINYPDSLSTLVADVNSRGVIAGSYLGTDNRWHGFLATPEPQAAPASAQTVSTRARSTSWRTSAPQRLDRGVLCAGLRMQYGRRVPRQWCDR
jgi:hypothetical protein